MISVRFANGTKWITRNWKYKIYYREIGDKCMNKLVNSHEEYWNNRHPNGFNQYDWCDQDFGRYEECRIESLQTWNDAHLKIELMKELLADLCHKQWSGWMKYLFSKCEANVIDGQPVTVIPNWAVERWLKQMVTQYSELSEDEKNSDRGEAIRFIKLLTKPNQYCDEER